MNLTFPEPPGCTEPERLCRQGSKPDGPHDGCQAPSREGRSTWPLRVNSKRRQPYHPFPGEKKLFLSSGIFWKGFIGSLQPGVAGVKEQLTSSGRRRGGGGRAEAEFGSPCGCLMKIRTLTFSNCIGGIWVESRNLVSFWHTWLVEVVMRAKRSRQSPRSSWHFSVWVLKPAVAEPSSKNHPGLDYYGLSWTRGTAGGSKECAGESCIPVYISVQLLRSSVAKHML